MPYTCNKVLENMKTVTKAISPKKAAKSLAKERSLPKKKQSTQKWNKNCQQPNFKYVLLINGS